MVSYEKNIVHVISESTQTLDYLAPVLYSIKRSMGREVKVTVLVATLNYRALINRNGFYDVFFKSNQINVIDLSDIVRSPALKCFLYFAKPLFGNLLSQKFSLFDIIFYGTFEEKIKNIPFLFYRAKKSFENFLIKKIFSDYIDFGEYHPDLLFFDLRKKYLSEGSVKIARAIQDSGIKTVIVPHAPHGISFCDDFVSFDENCFPSNCVYWLPLKRKDCRGFGFDKKMGAKYFQSGLPLFKSGIFSQAQHDNTEQIKILYVPEKFSSYKVNQFDVVDIETLLRRINKLINCLIISNVKFSLTIKVHPKIIHSDVIKLKNLLKEKGVVFSRDPIISHIQDTDLVVSEFSTAMLYFCSYRPVFFLETDLAKTVFCRWPFLRELYFGVSQGEFDISILKKIIGGDYLQLVDKQRKGLRYFFGEGREEVYLHHINELLGKKG